VLSGHLPSSLAAVQSEDCHQDHKVFFCPWLGQALSTAMLKCFLIDRRRRVTRTYYSDGRLEIACFELLGDSSSKFPVLNGLIG